MQLKVNGKRLSLALHVLIVNGQIHHFLCTANFPFLLELKKQESSHEVTGITRGSGEAQYSRKTQLAFVISVQFNVLLSLPAHMQLSNNGKTQCSHQPRCSLPSNTLDAKRLSI